MWVESLIPQFGSVSLKRYFSYLLAACIAAFLWALLATSVTHAADATWQDGNISYQNRALEGPKEATGTSSNGLAAGVKYYEKQSTESVNGQDVTKSYIVSFPKDTDVETASSASYAEYTLVPPDTYTPVAGSAKNISIDKKSETGAGSKPKESTTCAVNGIGYILCPIMRYIADGMDWLYGILQTFLEIRPLSNDTDSSLYKAWSYMLTFANVAFVIAFLVIIYSYLTGAGVQNYDLRKIIPRLIIAAALVNTSYYLCAILVDLSNISGANLQDMFANIKNELGQGQAQNKLDAINWKEATAYALSAGTLGGAGLVALSGGGAGLVYMLVPILVIAITAVMVTVAVLAARQAIIIILIILSPIAFAAFVLPGTQKFFDKWKNIFQTMLVMYPLFSVMFGGSQLAAYLIAQNASRAEVVLLALFVSVAPLVLTPFLIKVSGGLLGKFAGIVNNPTKGFGDRAKNWATGKKDLAKARRLADNSLGSGLARKLDDGRRRDEALKKRYETRRNRKFNTGALGQNLAVEQMIEDDRLAAADNLNKSAYEELKRNDAKVRFGAIQVKIAEMALNVNKANMDSYLEGLQSKQGAKFFKNEDAAIAPLARRMHELSHEQHVANSAQQFAKEQDRLEYSQDMNRGPGADALRTAAAGIAGDKGKALAAARAVQEMRSDFGKSAAAMEEMMDHFKVSGDEITMLSNPANTTDVVKVSKDGKTKFTFKAGDEYAIDAATKVLFEKKGNYKTMKEIVMRSGTDESEDYLSTIVSGVTSGMVKKAPWVGGKNADIITKGEIKSEADYDAMVRATIADGKFKSQWLAEADSTGLNDIGGLLEDNMNMSGLNSAQRRIYQDRITAIRRQAGETLDNKNINNLLTDEARIQLRMIAGRDRYKKIT